MKEKISKANKGIGLITCLYPYLPRKTLVNNSYKAFVRPHLDYGDIIYDNPNNDTFCHKIESVQYNAALEITCAIRGTSREKLYQELGLEYLSDRRWCRRLCFFYKIINNQTTSYIKNFISPKRTSSYRLRISKVYIVVFLAGLNDFNLHFPHIAYLNGNSIQNFKIMFLYRPSNVHYYLFLFFFYLVRCPTSYERTQNTRLHR